MGLMVRFIVAFIFALILFAPYFIMHAKRDRIAELPQAAHYLKNLWN